MYNLCMKQETAGALAYRRYVSGSDARSQKVLVHSAFRTDLPRMKLQRG